MIKRRYYRLEHGEKDGASSDSSSSSSDDDSDVEPQVSEEGDDVDHSVDRSTQQPELPPVASSGYESEDSSGNEIEADRAGLITREDDSESESDKDLLNANPFSRKEIDDTLETKSEDFPVSDNGLNCVLKAKSVYKCRLCPKIVCLNEESLMTHLKSKRHARSEKLLNNGRLKRYLNSDGEEEVITDDEGETHAERHARIMSMAKQDTALKKSKGRQRQRQRLRKKKDKNSSDIPSSGQKRENRAKRRKKDKNTSGIPSSGQQRENRAKRRKKNVD